MKILKNLLIFSLSFLFSPKIILAHCPLCTLGTTGLLMGALWIGVSEIVVGLFLGAFAISIGLWFSRVLNKKFGGRFFLTAIVVTISFLATILPLNTNLLPFNLKVIGSFNKLFAGSLLGALLVFVSPFLSKKISKIRKGKNFPFQTMLITFFLLIIFSIIIELIKRKNL